MSEDTVLLENYITHKKGFAFKSIDLGEPFGIPVVKLSNISGSKVNLRSCQLISKEKAENLKAYIIKKNDVILSTVGSWPSNPESVVGKVIRADEEIENALLNQNAVMLRANKGMSQVYLYYLLYNKDFKDYIVNTAQGSANQASITLKDVFNYSFSLPPLPEQQAIAEVLSSLDDKIDLLHRNNKTLEEMAETVFRQWFVEGAKEDWEVKNLGDIVNTVLGGTPNTSIPDYWDGDIAWINSGEVNKDRIIKPTRYISEKGLKNSNAKLLPKKSTVIAITGATMGQVSFLEIDTCANQSVIGLIPNEVYYAEFLHLLVKNHIVDMVQNETGGAQPHINKNDVNSTPVKLPPVEKLASKKECFQSLYSKVCNNWEQISDLEKTRDTLLPKLMSGQVRVNKSA